MKDLQKECKDGFKTGDQVGNGWGKFYTIKKHYTGSYIDIDKDKVWSWIQENYVSKYKVREIIDIKKIDNELGGLEGYEDAFIIGVRRTLEIVNNSIEEILK